MAIQGVGRFVVKGVQGNLTYTGAVTVAAGSNKMVGASFRDEFNVTEHRDGTSGVFAVTADDPVFRLSVRFIPTADAGTNTLVNSQTNITLPTRLSVVALAGFGRANINGNWYYQGGSIDHSPDSPVELSMDLARYGTDPESPTITGNPLAFT